MDTELTADLFHGPCDIMRQLYKAFLSLWHHQSHSYLPIWASDRVYPNRELLWYNQSHSYSPIWASDRILYPHRWASDRILYPHRELGGY